jgi:Fe2+ or Zn2+ uptake regulation protein
MTERASIKKLSPQKKFGSNLSHHYHIHCPYCNTIDKIKIDSQVKLEKSFQNVTKDTSCDNYYFELISVCSSCRNKILEQKKEIERIALNKKQEVLTWNN